MDERDNVPSYLERITVPDRVGYVGSLREEGTPEYQAPKGFRQLEEGGMSHGEIARQCGFSTSEIRRVWDF